MSKTKAQLETELRSLRVKLAHAEKLAIERLNDLNRLQTARREDVQLHDNLQDRLLACEAERDEARSAAAELRDRVGNLEAGIADRNAKVARLHKERDAATQERDGYAGKLADAEKWLIESFEQRDAAAAKERAYKASIVEMTAQRDAAISAKDQAEVEREAMRIGKLTVEADLRRITVELNEALRERDNAVLACRMLAAKSEAIDELTAQRDTAERERGEYAGQLTEAESQRDEARAAESKAEAEWGEAMQELEVVRARLTGAETAVESLLAKRDEVEAERDYARGQAEKAWAALDPARKGLDKAREERDKVEAELAAEQTRSAQYAAQLIEKGAAVSFLEGQLAAAKAELTALRLDLESAKNVRKLIEEDRSKAESRANYWEKRAREAMRPWWRRTLDGLCSFTSEGGAS